MANHPLYPISHSQPQPSPQQGKTFTYLLLLRLWHLLTRTCMLFQSVQPIYSSGLNILLNLLITCIRQQSKIYGHSTQQSNPGSTLVITIWVCHNMPKKYNLVLAFLTFISFYFSILATWTVHNCMTCLKI